ncbi:MAG TPA: thioredoxin family protein [Flavobacteriales bacterium]|nr:thioredoxin family protein [Flavobacteriales bacterium]HMR29196.1 thioredoxin family protein [Flavobacteriales bacterium]
MRSPLLALLVPVLIHGTVSAQGTTTTAPSAGAAINWLSLEQAQAATKKVPKPILVDVYTNWCGPCKMLASRTFTDARLVEYVNAHFYAVKFNAEGGDPVTFKGQTFKNPQYNPAAGGGRNGTHELTYAIANVEGRIAYPTVVYLNENLDVIAPVQGYLTPQQIEPILKYIGEGAYKKQDYPSFQTGFTAGW